MSRRAPLPATEAAALSTIVSAALLSATAGCTAALDPGQDRTAIDIQVRLFNAMSDSGPLEVLVDGRRFGVSVESYRDGTGYVPGIVGISGRRDAVVFEVVGPDDGDLGLRFAQPLVRGVSRDESFTVVPYRDPESGEPRLVVLDDVRSAAFPQTGFVTQRVLHVGEFTEGILVVECQTADVGAPVAAGANFFQIYRNDRTIFAVELDDDSPDAPARRRVDLPPWDPAELSLLVVTGSFDELGLCLMLDDGDGPNCLPAPVDDGRCARASE